MHARVFPCDSICDIWYATYCMWHTSLQHFHGFKTRRFRIPIEAPQVTFTFFSDQFYLRVLTDVEIELVVEFQLLWCCDLYILHISMIHHLRPFFWLCFSFVPLFDEIYFRWLKICHYQDMNESLYSYLDIVMLKHLNWNDPKCGSFVPDILSSDIWSSITSPAIFHVHFCPFYIFFLDFLFSSLWKDFSDFVLRQ